MFIPTWDLHPLSNRRSLEMVARRPWRGDKNMARSVGLAMPICHPGGGTSFFLSGSKTKSRLAVLGWVVSAMADILARRPSQGEMKS